MTLSAFAQTPRDSCVQDALNMNFDTPAEGTMCVDDSPIFLAWSQEVEAISGDGVTGQDGKYFDPSISGEGIAQIDVTIYHYCDQPTTRSFEDYSYYVKVEDCNAASILGCIDLTATNYEESANTDNGSCTYETEAEVAYETTISTAETVGSSDIQGEIISYELDGSILTVVWVVFLPNTSYEVVSVYDVAVNSGVIAVELSVLIENFSSKENQSKTASVSKTLKKGVDLSTVTAISEDKGITNHLSIYPQPVSNVLTISLDQSIQNVSIFNSAGQLVIDDKTNENLDVSSLTSGIYTLVLRTGEKDVISTKFIKE